jgi:hypothetical protein
LLIGGARDDRSAGLGGGGLLRGGSGLFHLAGGLVSLALLRIFLCLATRFLFGGLARLFLAAARFFGRRQNRNLFLLSPLGLTLGRLALLFDQRALAGGEFRLGQRAAGTGRRTPGGHGPTCTRRSLRRRCRARWSAGRTNGGALLAHLHLHDLRPAVTEALPYGAGIHGAAQLQASRRAQREPALASILIVAFAHALPVDTRLIVQTGSYLPSFFPPATVWSPGVQSLSSQPGQPVGFEVKPFGQSPRRDRHMHHMVAPEHAPQRRRRQRRDNRHPSGIAGQEPRPFGLTPVRGFQDQPSAATP